MSDPKIELLIKQHWGVFKDNHLSELMNYIDEYDLIIQEAKVRDFNKWQTNDRGVSALKFWIENRVSYMDNFIDSF